MSKPSPFSNSPQNTDDQEDFPVYETTSTNTAPLTPEQVTHLRNFYDRVEVLKKEQTTVQKNLDQRRAELVRVREPLANQNLPTPDASLADVEKTLLLEIDKLKDHIGAINVKMKEIYRQADEYKRSLITTSPTTTIKASDTTTSIQKQRTDTTTNPIPSVIRASDVIHASNRDQSISPDPFSKIDVNDASQTDQSTNTIATSGQNEILNINEQLRINKVMTNINNERTIKAKNIKTNEEILIGKTEFPITHITKNKNGGYDVKAVKDNIEVAGHLSDNAFKSLLNRQLSLEIEKNKADIVKLASKMSMIQETIGFRESQKHINKLSLVDKIVLARRHYRKLNIEMSYKFLDKDHESQTKPIFELKDSEGKISLEHISEQELNKLAAHQVAEELYKLKKEINLNKQELLDKSAEQRDLLLMRLREVDQELTALNTKSNNQNNEVKDEFDEFLKNHHTEKIHKTQQEFEQIRSELNKTTEQIDKNNIISPQDVTIPKRPSIAIESTIRHQSHDAIRPRAIGRIEGARESATTTRTFSETNLLEAIGNKVKEFTRTPEINRPVSITLSQKEIIITSNDQNKEINFKATSTLVNSDNINDKNLQAMSVTLVENLKNKLIEDPAANNLAIQLGDCKPPYVASKFAKYLNIELDKLKISSPDLKDRIKNVPVPIVPTIAASRQENLTSAHTRPRGPSTSRG